MQIPFEVALGLMNNNPVELILGLTPLGIVRNRFHFKDMYYLFARMSGQGAP